MDKDTNCFFDNTSRFAPLNFISHLFCPSISYSVTLSKGKSKGFFIPFSIDKSYTVEELEALKDKGRLQDALISVDTLFSEYPAVYLNPKQVKSVTNGVRMTYRGEENQLYRVYDENKSFLCVSKIIDGKLTLEKSFWS